MSSFTTPPSRLTATAASRKTSGSSTRPAGAPRARKPTRSGPSDLKPDDRTGAAHAGPPVLASAAGGITGSQRQSAGLGNRQAVALLEHGDHRQRRLRALVAAAAETAEGVAAPAGPLVEHRDPGVVVAE